MSAAPAQWRADPQIEHMQDLHDQDPEQFRQTFGARGLIRLGMYRSDKQRAQAAGLDVTTR